MDNTELIAELLQAVNNDVQELKNWTKRVPTATPTDYRAQFEQLASSFEQLQTRLAQPTAAPVVAPVSIDTTAINEQLTRIERAVHNRPEYKMSQYVRNGAYAFGLMVALLTVTIVVALQLKSERDRFEASDWKWRAVRQESPKYADRWDGIFSTDSTAINAQQWTIQREQADATREAARKAAEQAAAMNAQADQLEGRSK